MGSAVFQEPAQCWRLPFCLSMCTVLRLTVALPFGKSMNGGIVPWHIIDTAFFVIMCKLWKCQAPKKKYNFLWFTTKVMAFRLISASTSSQQSWIPVRSCIFSSSLWDSSRSVLKMLSISACVVVFVKEMTVRLGILWETSCSRMHIMGAQAHWAEGPCGFNVHMTDRLRPMRLSMGPDRETGVVNKDRGILSVFIFHAVIAWFRMNSLTSLCTPPCERKKENRFSFSLCKENRLITHDALHHHETFTAKKMFSRMNWWHAALTVLGFNLVEGTDYT